MPEARWPELPYDAWKDTYSTLHMWSQIVGKVALAQAAPVNHSWAVALHLTGRGLTTGMLPHGTRSFSMAFDFLEHQLAIDTSDGVRRVLPLVPRTVADFYERVMAALDDMDLPVKIWPVPVEIPAPIPFERDTVHHAYDPEFVSRFWRILVQVHRVFSECRSGFLGKCSPVHFFWGSFDLAVTRFSGRRAPERPGADSITRESYSHEVISHGWWPGGGPVNEPAFYAYAAPEPPGFKTVVVEPIAAFYSQEFSEFVLPYEAVRTAASPEADLRAFLHTTYDAAAQLAQWDRETLERR